MYNDNFTEIPLVDLASQLSSPPPFSEAETVHL